MRGSNWPKTVLQWVSLLVFIFLATGLAQKYLPGFVSELQQRVSASGDFIVSLPTMRLAIVVAVFLFAVFFTRFFCGYICPVGTVQDFLMSLRNGFGISQVNVRPGRVLDNVLRLFKYLILFALTYVLINGIGVPYARWMLIAVAVIIVVGGLLVDRFWCKYICPIGASVNTVRFWVLFVALTAAFWALNTFLNLGIDWIWLLAAYCVFGYLQEIILRNTRLHLFRIVKEEDRCTHCGDCGRACPYSLNVQNCGNRLNDVDCTLCGECVAVCRRKALGVGIVRKTSVNRGVARFLPPVFAILFVLAILFVPGMVAPEAYGTSAVAEEPVSVEESADDVLMETPEDTVALVAEPEIIEPAGFHESGIEIKDRRSVYGNNEWWVLEYVSGTFDNLDVDTALPVLAAYLGKYNGAIGVYSRYDAENVPVIDILYANPLRKAAIYEAVAKDTWSYKGDDGVSVSVPAAIIFPEKGVGRSYKEHKDEFGF